MARLVVERLTVRYQDFEGDYSAIFESGVPTALIGPSGSGKSSLIDLIAEPHRASSGRCVLDESTLTNLDVVRWRGELTERPSRREGPIWVSAGQRERFVEIATALGTGTDVLEGWLDRVDSRGDLVIDLPALSVERSIVGLASVLAASADVVLLDEPTMTVATVEHNRRLTEVIRSLTDRIVIIASHDADWLRATVSRTLVVDTGRIIAETEIAAVDFSVVNARTLEVTRARQGTI